MGSFQWGMIKSFNEIPIVIYWFQAKNNFKHQWVENDDMVYEESLVINEHSQSLKG